MALHRILVGLDGSTLAESILEPLRTIAAHLGAHVVLLHVTPVPEGLGALPPRPLVDDMLAREQEAAQTYLDQVARKLGTKSLTLETALAIGEPAAQIVRYAERERIDLIALATHGRSGMKRWLYGSVTDRVLHTTATPLLLLRPTEIGTAEPATQPRIVVPLDGSPLAEGALPFAGDLARALDAAIVLVRVVELVGLTIAGESFGTAYFDYQGVLDLMQADAERYLATVANDLRRQGLAVETVAKVGLASETITAVAGEYPGAVVVMTTHGRTGWRGLVLGSVARRVVLLASGPVFVVRPVKQAGATCETRPATAGRGR